MCIKEENRLKLVSYLIIKMLYISRTKNRDAFSSTFFNNEYFYIRY